MLPNRLRAALCLLLILPVLTHFPGHGGETDELTRRLEEIRQDPLRNALPAVRLLPDGPESDNALLRHLSEEHREASERQIAALAADGDFPDAALPRHFTQWYRDQGNARADGIANPIARGLFHDWLNKYLPHALDALQTARRAAFPPVRHPDQTLVLHITVNGRSIAVPAPEAAEMITGLTHSDEVEHFTARFSQSLANRQGTRHYYLTVPDGLWPDRIDESVFSRLAQEASTRTPAGRATVITHSNMIITEEFVPGRESVSGREYWRSELVFAVKDRLLRLIVIADREPGRELHRHLLAWRDRILGANRE